LLLITNDGEENWFISPQSIVPFFWKLQVLGKTGVLQRKNKAVDFLRFFAAHNAENLDFLTALADEFTFPFHYLQNIQLLPNHYGDNWIRGFRIIFGIQDGFFEIFICPFPKNLDLQKNNFLVGRHDHDSWIPRNQLNPTNLSASKRFFKRVFYSRSRTILCHIGIIIQTELRR